MVSRIEKRWALPTFIVLGVLVLFFTGSKFGLPTSVQAELPDSTSHEASRCGGQTSGNSKIVVVPIQIERDKYGLAMVDTVSQTLWIYELNNIGPAHSRLRLLAARSWKYDKLLKQYNTAEPKPEQVKMLLEEASSKQPKEQVDEKQESSEANIAEENAVETDVAETSTAEANDVEVNKPNE